MRFIPLVSTLLVLSNNFTPSTASSTRPTALHPRAISHPSDVSLRIVPTAGGSQGLGARALSGRDQPKFDDRFTLSFTSHDVPFILSLRPSSTILHPDGTKYFHTHVDDDGVRTTESRVLMREEARVYQGWVLSEGEDLEHWEREEVAGVRRGDEDGDGWARMVLLPPTGEADDELRFQGSFMSGGETFTVHSTANYLRSKEDLDPEPPLLRKRTLTGSTLEHPSMIVIRENETLSPQEQVAALRKRGVAVPEWPSQNDSLLASAVPTTGCGHDDLEFNMDPHHPVHDQSVFAGTSPWASELFGMRPSSAPFEPMDHSMPVKAMAYPPRKLGRRQGDISGGTNMGSNFVNSIGSTAGCPKSAMVVFVGVAADCSYVAHYGSADLARTQILTDFNSASALYSASLNISLGIVELNVQSGPCPTTTAQVDPRNPWNVGCQEGGGPGIALNVRLSVFSAWRGQKGGGDRAGLWHLMTNCSSGSEVGVAWLGQLCKVSATTSQGQSTSGTGVTAVSRNEWAVVAHEIGHNFGAIHDCASGCSLSGSNPVCCPLTSSTCDSQANFIMSPVSIKNVSNFSPCSIGNICTVLSGSLNTTCLAIPGAIGNPALISLQACGNGILEAGEDCDPGAGSADPCCNASTCKFRTGAVCSPTNSLCCSSSCQIAAAGTVCRPSADATCDTAEVCTGTSSGCPADVFASDGTSCGSNDLACASGLCTSRAVQCQTAGSSLGIRDACPIRASDSCSITCADPSSSNNCIVLEQSFRDGSPCGYAGTCKNSVCNAGAPLAVATSWYRQNLQISIPVTVVVGVLVIVLIIAIFRCCSRRKAKTVAPSSQFGATPVSQYPPPPNHRSSTSNSNSRNYNQQSQGYYAGPPAVPPPRFDGGRAHTQQTPVARYGDSSLPPPPRRSSRPSNPRSSNWVDANAYNGPPRNRPT